MKDTVRFDSYSEILEIAIDREIEANQFYLTLAEHVDNKEMRKVFWELALEELEHKDKLELEIMKIGKTVKERQPPATPRKNHIVSDSNSLFGMDYKDMLLLGIEKEDAAFRFYVDLVPNAYDEESREMLLALAQEEVRHKLRFQIEYNTVTKQ